MQRSVSTITIGISYFLRKDFTDATFFKGLGENKKVLKNKNKIQ